MRILQIITVQVSHRSLGRRTYHLWVAVIFRQMSPIWMLVSLTCELSVIDEGYMNHLREYVQKPCGSTVRTINIWVINHMRHKSQTPNSCCTFWWAMHNSEFDVHPIYWWVTYKSYLLSATTYDYRILSRQHLHGVNALPSYLSVHKPSKFLHTEDHTFKSACWPALPGLLYAHLCP